MSADIKADVKMIIRLLRQKHIHHQMSPGLFQQQVLSIPSFSGLIDVTLANALAGSKGLAQRFVTNCNLYLSGFADFEEIFEGIEANTYTGEALVFGDYQL
jgi:hypothetical protein